MAAASELAAFGFFGSLRGGCSSGNSPGCCTLMNSVRRSGTVERPAHRERPRRRGAV